MTSRHQRLGNGGDADDVEIEATTCGKHYLALECRKFSRLRKSDATCRQVGFETQNFGAEGANFEPVATADIRDALVQPGTGSEAAHPDTRS
jgi:hypothetical protein